MFHQLTEEAFNAKSEAILERFPSVKHRAPCAALNAEQALVECEGYSRWEACIDRSQEFLDYFAMSLEGFAE